jgi:hypothetical protein
MRNRPDREPLSENGRRNLRRRRHVGKQKRVRVIPSLQYSSQHQYQYRRSRPILPRRYHYLSYYFAHSQIDNNTLA